MGHHVLPGNPPISVALRRSARARRLSLRVSRLDGRVTLTLPLRVSEREGLEFLQSRAGWVRDHLAGLRGPSIAALGGAVPFQGQDHVIVQGTGRSVRALDGQIAVPGHPGAAGARVLAFLKVQARERLAAASDHYAAALGRPYRRLTLRDTRSRWGSCSSHGDLMYSWRLIMAPPAVLDYVAAHEVAHLAEMNHSPAFWAVVERLFPDHAACRSWLRTEGETLHRVRFGN